MIVQINLDKREAQCFDIRKLTPRETGRLMGVREPQLDAMQASGLRPSALYKLFGNSIVVDVLAAIYRQVWYNDPTEQRSQQLELFPQQPWQLQPPRKARLISLCSGYESQAMAFDVLRRWAGERGLPAMDCELVAWAEFDPESKAPLDRQPAVVAHNACFPDAADRNLGDMTKIDWQEVIRKYNIKVYGKERESMPCDNNASTAKSDERRTDADTSERMCNGNSCDDNGSRGRSMSGEHADVGSLSDNGDSDSVRQDDKVLSDAQDPAHARQSEQAPLHSLNRSVLNVGAEIDLLTYSTPCFVAGTLVQTEGGLMPIEQVMDGDRVLTHTRQWQEVAATGVKPFTGELYTIRSMCSHDIRCTPEHPFYVRRMRRVGHDWHRTFDQPEWTPARELTKAHYLGMAIDAHSDMPDWQGAIDNRWGHGRIVNEVGPMMQRQEFWYLMGRYVGDGWRRWDDTHKGIIICCADREADRKPIVERMEALGLHYVETCERTVRRITVNSRELAEFVTRYGYRADGKHIDTETLRLPQELLRSFVEGYMAADGHYDEQMHHWRCTTVSRELAYGLAQCVAKAYHAVPKVYYVRRRPQVVIEGRTCHQRNQWCVHYKTEVCPQDKAFYDDGYIWFPISSITTAQVSDVPVYNLEVSGDNSYTANNAIVHNCTDISQAGKRAGIKKDSGTRSAVLWYTEEAIRSLRPRLLLQENVAALVNQQNAADFRQWRDTVQRLGYHSSWVVLNARDIGIDPALGPVPQNRDRLFMLSWRDDLGLPDQFPWPQPQALTRTIADVLDPDVPDTFYLRAESVISFLTRNEQGDRCLYRVSDHLPTPDEVRQWVREMENEGKSEVRTPADHHTKRSLQHIAQRLSPTDEVEKWVENEK